MPAAACRAALPTNILTPLANMNCANTVLSTDPNPPDTSFWTFCLCLELLHTMRESGSRRIFICFFCRVRGQIFESRISLAGNCVHRDSNARSF